jgi:hypothetical protein
MDRRAVRNVALSKAALSLVGILCLMPFASSWADEYQDAITKVFPGFKSLSRSEFSAEIQGTVKGNPGLITGRFNDDDLEDFAAIIREIAIRPGEYGAREYYPGKRIICHGLGTGQYRCQVLSETPIFLPYGTYVSRVSPGKVKCGERAVTIKRDAVGFESSNAAVAYIYQPDGSYRKCVTAD